MQHSFDHASLAATTTAYLRKLEGAADPSGPRLAEPMLGSAPPDDGGQPPAGAATAPHPAPAPSTTAATG